MGTTAIKSNGDTVNQTEFRGLQFSGLRGFDSEKSSLFTASVGVGYPVNTNGGSFTVTLESLSSKSVANPEHGGKIILIDSGNNWFSNNLTVTAGSGDTVEFVSSILLDGSQGKVVEFLYNAADNNWSIIGTSSSAVIQRYLFTRAVNLKSVAQTRIYTVPTGKKLIIQAIDFIISAATPATGVPTFQFGTTSTPADLISATALDSLMVTSGKRQRFIIASDSYAASTVLEVGITVAGTDAGSYEADVGFDGILLVA